MGDRSSCHLYSEYLKKSSTVKRYVFSFNFLVRIFFALCVSWFYSKHTLVKLSIRYFMVGATRKHEKIIFLGESLDY